MQLNGLTAMTTLPLDLVDRCIGDHDIVSAIPVETDRPAYESILLAVRWSTWDDVRLGVHVGGSDAGDVAAPFWLVVHVGERAYAAMLRGPAGRIALRDFVVATQVVQRS